MQRWWRAASCRARPHLPPRARPPLTSEGSEDEKHQGGARGGAWPTALQAAAVAAPRLGMLPC